jgi:hypothetical protein
MLVGSFGARSGVREEQTAEIAVDTRNLHFFDPETSLGIYEDAKPETDTGTGGNPDKGGNP